MPISRKSSKSKSMKKSLNNKKVSCKDKLKQPGLQYTIALTCARHRNKDKITCNNDLKKSFLTQCKKTNKNSHNTSNKKPMSPKNVLKNPFIKKIVYLTCKPYPKEEKKECEKSVNKRFLNEFKEKMKSMKGGKCCKCKGGRGAWGTSCYDNPKNCCKKTKTVKDMEKMMKTNNQTNKKSNTKKTKKSFMSKLVFWK